MSGEYIKAETIDEYWDKLKAIYNQRSEEWKDLTAEEYGNIENSERNDSDNHLNEERLGKDTDVIDICRYKFMPDRYAAYHVRIIHKDGSDKDHYFKIKLKENFD